MAKKLVSLLLALTLAVVCGAALAETTTTGVAYGVYSNEGEHPDSLIRVTLTLDNGAITAAELDEKLMDVGSAVAGCGGAFACLFLEGLADGAVYAGLPRAKAQRYAAQMLLGMAKLALASDEHTGALKDAVCSPGGTTIAGVRALEERGFRAAAMNAVIAAYERTKELG